MAVITISREFGSEGTYIGKKVAETLNYHFVDKFVIEKVLNDYGYVQFRQLYETTPGFWTRYDSINIELIRMLNRVILAFASNGNTVIMGRGGFAVLDGYADVLNVRIQAPADIRAGRIMRRDQLPDLHTAEERVKANDQVRATFIQAFYNQRWDAADAFNLVIYTYAVPPDQAVQWICVAARELEQREIASEKSTRFIEVDSVLANRSQYCFLKPNLFRVL